MHAWEDYPSCCGSLAASDPAVLYCPECGHALLRCPVAGCGGLVTPLGHCRACVDLQLSIEDGAVLEARTGECLSIPFVLTNRSARPVSVKAVVRDGTTMVHEPVAIQWGQLDARRSRAFSVDVGPFAHGGINSLRLTLVVVTRVEDDEEVFAFAGTVAIDVSGADPTQIVQHFNLSGADFGTAGMVVASPQAAVGEGTRARTEVRTRVDVALERAERYELERGHRGYQQPGVRVPRDTEVVYAGFPADDRPADGPLLRRPVIRCGRNGRGHGSPSSSDANDLCLRLYHPASGELDREGSRAISRRACDFAVRNDRLYVTSLGDGSVALNGAALAAGETRPIASGDAITAPARGASAVSFTVRFKTSSDLVTQVRFEKAS